MLEPNQPGQITVSLLKRWFVEEDVAPVTQSLLFSFLGGGKKKDIITKDSFNFISKADCENCR